MQKRTAFVGLLAFGIGLLCWNQLLQPIEYAEQTLILGHGGAGMTWPDRLNSSKGFQKAIYQDVDGAEIDVVVTKDSILLVQHDLRLCGTCELIAHRNWREIRTGSSATEPLALDSILSFGWKHGTTFSLDLKLSETDSKADSLLLTKVTETTRSYPNFNFLIEAQNIATLKKSDGLSCRAELFWLYRYQEDRKFNFQEFKKVECEFVDGISIRNDRISANDIDSLHGIGKKVMLWDIGTPWDNRNALGKSPDIIQTDNIWSAMKLKPREI